MACSRLLIGRTCQATRVAKEFCNSELLLSPGRQLKLRDRGCAKHPGRFTLFPRVYLRCYGVDTFFQKRLAFSFYASVTIPCSLFPSGLLPFVVFHLLVACPLSRYFSMSSSLKFLSAVKRILITTVFICHTLFPVKPGLHVAYKYFTT